MCLGYALFSPRISSPSLSLYLHVLSISRNCLAPPHIQESRIACFIPSVFIVHTVLSFLASSSVLYVLCIHVVFFDSEICLVPVFNSWYLFPAILPSPASPVYCCFVVFVSIVVSMCYPSSFSV